MGSSGSRTEWALAAVIAVLFIGTASQRPVATLIIAWPLGTFAIVGLIFMRARTLGDPPSISRAFLRSRSSRPRRSNSH
ncbi:MAG: hypothetical protein ACXVFQ_23385 [Solirubrobacteraceae bacterium]